MTFCWPAVVLCASSILSGAVAADLDTREALFDFKADVTIDGRRLQPVGVRKKGYIGTSVSTRPSLKIRLDRYAKAQRLAGLDMLTFNNNYQDDSQARQWLAYFVMRKAGVAAPRCNLAHVTVNGEDLGIYTHIESIRKPYIENHFANTAGELYEGFGGRFCD